MSDAFDCDVLIVGLGPVGAALAALLSRRDVSTIAIEKETGVYPLPRAAHFDHEVMRIFQELGIAHDLAACAQPAPAYEFRARDGQVLLRMESAHTSVSGWASGYMFHQPDLERALRGLLAAAGNVEMRLGWVLRGLTQSADGVAAQVDLPDGARTLRARYLVGCDGASSSVREALDIALEDYAFDEPWLVIDAVLSPGSRVPEVNLQICDPQRPTTCVLMGPGRHRWEFMLLPGEAPEQVLHDEFIEALLLPWDCGDITIERRAVYRFHGLVARSWRDSRVLLAGDAAHQTPPFAGQGMCSGLRDAANLAWKLAAVIKGHASDRLLDTYQDEREPHARALIELAIEMGRVVCTLDPDAARRRDGDMLARRAEGQPGLPPSRPAPISKGCVLADSAAAGMLFPQTIAPDGAKLDDALGEGPWLITGAEQKPPCNGVTVFDLNEQRLAPFRAAIARWMDKTGASAVLVRPDRYVFGAGEARALVSAWTAAMQRGNEK